MHDKTNLMLDRGPESDQCQILSDLLLTHQPNLKKTGPQLFELSRLHSLQRDGQKVRQTNKP